VDEILSLEEMLEALLDLAHPLEPFDMPLLDAHGATLADDLYVGDEVVLPVGSPIRAAQVGFAASLGLHHLPTRPHPRVVVISAGDDLVQPGESLLNVDDQFETNSWMLAVAMKEAGATAYRVHAIPENEEALASVIEDQLVRADLIVITGEREDKSFDLITGVLQGLGSLRTAQPALVDSGRYNFGTIGPDATPVVTLPGDPISAYLGAELFIRPMVRTMLGVTDLFRPRVKATLKDSVRSPRGKRSFIRVRVEGNGKSKSFSAIPLPHQESLQSLSIAHGLMLIGEETEEVSSGTTVDVLLLNK
jgi:molybdopterin molybdotransferase